MMSEVTREDDERHLRWLAWRDQGIPQREIAIRDGAATKGQVNALFRRVKADYAASLRMPNG